MVRHFAEKQQDDESDSRILRENTQPVPDMFRTLLTETLDHVAKLTDPLRATLKLQCETGRLLPWYRADDLVPFTGSYTRLMGNLFWLDIERNRSSNAIERASILRYSIDLYGFQLERRRNGALRLTWPSISSEIVWSKRCARARPACASDVGTAVIGASERMGWHTTHLHVGELEEHIRSKHQRRFRTPHLCRLRSVSFSRGSFCSCSRSARLPKSATTVCAT